MPPPPYRSPEFDPERILAYGGTGAGKSYGAGTIALNMGPNDTMFVIDTDNGWGRLVSELGLTVREWWNGKTRDKRRETEDGRLVVYSCRDWPEVESAYQDALKRALPDEWIVLDGATWAWEWLGKWVVKHVHGEELPIFLLDAYTSAKQANKGATPESAMLELYNYINPIWFAMATELFVRPPCHVYVTAEAKEVRTDRQGDKKAARQLYGHIGMKPSSQNRLGFNVQTALYLERTNTGERRMTTAKDRGGRVEFDGDPMEDLFKTYLVQTAGWKRRRDA